MPTSIKMFSHSPGLDPARSTIFTYNGSWNTWVKSGESVSVERSESYSYFYENAAGFVFL